LCRDLRTNPWVVEPVGVAHVRTVKTASGATAVQIVHSRRRGSRDVEHIGSAHTLAEVEVLKAAARQRLHANQDTPCCLTSIGPGVFLRCLMKKVREGGSYRSPIRVPLGGWWRG
jgi:hypothetical protein